MYKKLISLFVVIILVLSLITPYYGTTVQASTNNQNNIIYERQTVFTSGEHTLAIKQDGTLWSWGRNNAGQLGNGTNNDRTSMDQVLGIDNVISVSGTSSSSLALKSDGTLWSWGSNINGQLGDGTTENKSTPVQVMGLNNIVSISGGGSFYLALKSDGTVWSWGANDSGQLGIGTSGGYRSVPEQIPNLTDIVAISTGTRHAIALNADGKVWAWGHNLNGQLGIGNTENQSTPIELSLGDIVSISAGSWHTMALNDKGGVFVWGSNSAYQMGPTSNNIGGNFPNPRGLGLVLFDVVSIISGGNHSFVIKSDQTLHAWGDNNVGQLGRGTVSEPSKHILKIVPLEDVVFATAGEASSFSLKSDGSLWAWGYNQYGQLGDGTTENKSLPVEIEGSFMIPNDEQNTLPEDLNHRSIATGYNQSFIIRNEEVWTWGRNAYGLLGDGTTVESRYSASVIDHFEDVVTISAGLNHNMALKSDGTVWSWGSNLEGQLGDGTTTNQTMPTKIENLNNIVAVAAGYNHSMALQSDGTVWIWGQNQYGQLGNDTTTARFNPEPIAGLKNIIAIAAGKNFSMALESDGSVWAWGDNQYGQIGAGHISITYSLIPNKVVNLSEIVSIQAGEYHSVALDVNGSVWTWGQNNYGQLGTGTFSQSVYSPRKVEDLSNINTITTSNKHTFALSSDGSLWAWGDNSSGQIGDGTSTHRRTPVQINLFNIVEVSAGHTHSMALQSDGTLWTWGQNHHGQLGDGTPNTQLSPIKVPDFPYFIAAPMNIEPLTTEPHALYQEIFAQRYYTIGVKLDGSLWIWGYEGMAGFDIGLTPTRINGLNYNDIKKIFPGESKVYALMNDGSVIAWGAGYLGDGTNNPKNEPTVIEELTDIIDIAPLTGSTVFLKQDGSIWAVGTNNESIFDYMGDQGRVYPEPIRISSLGFDNVAIFSGSNSSGAFAVKEDGSVYSWGNETAGNLGRGNTAYKRLPPGPVPNLKNVHKIISQNGATLAFADDGIWAFGVNTMTTSDRKQYLRLGVDSRIDILTPQKTKFDNVKDVAIGFFHTTILLNDGTVWSLGTNGDESQGHNYFGDNTYLTSSTPVQTHIDRVAKISSNNTHTFAIREDGTLWVWGQNKSTLYTPYRRDVGIYGVSNLENSLVPIQTGYEINKSTIETINENPSETTVDDLYDIGIENVVEENMTEYQEALNEYKDDINRDLTEDDIQKIIDAVNAVIKAEKDPSDVNIEVAQEKINLLEEGNLKDNLQERLDQLKRSLIPDPPAHPTYAYNPVLGASYIGLNWMPSARAEYYLIERNGDQIARTEGFKFDEYITDKGTYTYKIYSANEYGQSEPYTINIEADHQDIPVVTDFRATSITRSEVTLEWSLVDGITNYDIFRNGLLLDSVSDGIYTDTQVKPESTYTYSITAKNQYNSSEPVEINVQIPSMKPSKPNILFNSTPTAVTLSWEEDSNTDYYRIDRNGIPIESNVADTRYVDQNVVPNTTYEYQVIAINEYGESASDIVSIKTESQLPAAPVVLSSVSTTAITLNWEVTDYTDHYRVERDGTIILDKLFGTTYTDDQLVPGTTYQYQVVAINETGEAASEVVQVTTLEPLLPEAPDQINFTATTDEVEISWNPTENTDLYRVKVDGKIVEETSQTTAVVFGLTPNTTYQIQIIAVNEHGEAVSQVIDVKTKPLAPTVTNVVYASTSTSITLSWSGEYADYYRIERDGQIIADHFTDLLYTDSAVSPATTYEYIIVGINESGETASHSIFATTNESPIDPLEAAIEAVQRAEQTLNSSDLDLAYQVVEQLDDSDTKDSLLERLRVVESKIRAKEAVELVETTIERRDFVNATNEVDTLSEDSFKNSLRSRLIFIEKFVDAHDALKVAMDTLDKAHIDEANQKITSLPDHQHKVRLQELLKQLLGSVEQPKPDTPEDRTEDHGNYLDNHIPEKPKGYRKEKETIIVFVPEKNLYDLGMIQIEDMKNITDIIFEVPEDMKQPIISIPKTISDKMLDNETKIIYEYQDVRVGIEINKDNLPKDTIQVELDFENGIRIESTKGTLISVQKDLPRNKQLNVLKNNTWVEFEGSHMFSKNEAIEIKVVHFEKTFLDIQDHWAQTEVEELASMKIIEGRNADLFDPHAAVTRAEYVAMLVRGLELERNNNENDTPLFSDVLTSKWYANDIAVAASYGFVEGFEDGTFQPHKQITREEMLTIMTRVYEAFGEEIIFDSKKLNAFDDHSEIGFWAVDHMAKAIELELTLGVTPTSLSPKKNASRAEAAVTIYRFLNDYQEFK